MSIKDKIDELVEEPKQEEASMDEVEIKELSEDMDALFNGETLSEEFKTKATTIFEAAVVTRVKQEVAALEEEFAVKLEKEIEAAKTGLVEDVDGLLNYMIEQWMNDNVVALESGIKTEITEGFITGLHQLFKENYIEVPEDKADLVADLEESVTELKSELTTAIQANIDLTKTINESLRNTITDKVGQGLTAVDSEKFRELVEELSFDNADIFEAKLVTIKENYFTKSTVKPTTQSVITDTPIEAITEEVVVTKPSNSRYAAVLKHLNQK